MGKSNNILDGIALILIIVGILIMFFSESQNKVNLGWAVLVIGIVKQIVAWR